MTMPLDLVLVRHGESEGNVAKARSERGDHSVFATGFKNRHSSSWRLSDKGIYQARLAGEWIRDNFPDLFHRYYVSEYVRAMETAAHLNLLGADWFVDFYLRERDWGDMEVMSEEERDRDFANSMARRHVQPFYWTPPNGVSMADLCLRIDRVIDTLHRECSDKRVIIVCHGEVMWAFRVRLERMSQEQYRTLHFSKAPEHRIRNGHILHYTRRNPKNGGVGDYLQWMRSTCPSDPNYQPPEWQPIVRTRYSNKSLRIEVARTERMIT